MIYHCNLLTQRFDNEIETVIYRIVQEVVFNAIKYAEIDFVDVDIEVTDERLVAKVVDKGKGFDKSAQPKGTGLGLYGMNERAELINAKVNIDTDIGKGTSVTVEVPL